MMSTYTVILKGNVHGRVMCEDLHVGDLTNVETFEIVNGHWKETVKFGTVQVIVESYENTNLEN